MSEVLSFLHRGLGRFLPENSTAQFLKSRSARVTIQETDARSFYTIKASPVTTISAGGHKFVLRIKALPEQMLRVSVYVADKGQTLADVTVAFGAEAGAMNLNLDNLHLKIDLDADPSERSAARQ